MACLAYRNGHHRFPPGPGTHGRGHGRRLPPDLRGAGRRLYGHGADLLQGPVLSRQEDPLPPADVPRGAPGGGADLRQRSGLHGGGGPDRPGALRRGHRGPEHGLSHGKDREQRRRRGIDEGPGEGRPHHGGGGEGRGRAGDRQIPPGLGHGQLQLRGVRTGAGAGGGLRRGGPRPDPGPGVQRPGGLDLHPGGEGGRSISR